MKLDDLAEEGSVGITREANTVLQRLWDSDGVVIVRDVIPEHKLIAYEDEWLSFNGGDDCVDGDVTTYISPGGYNYATPYMQHPALRDLVCDGDLANILHQLTGEPMGVHLNLTGWVSTRRNWHRDQYLNEPYVGEFYAAVWIALDDIHPDAGPFEYIRGSHRGKPISQWKVRQALGEDGTGPDWPTHSERILTPLFEEEMSRTGVTREQFLAKRGDILIWHGRLLHRGTVPRDDTRERRALIAHYSGIHHRPDMPPARGEGDGWLFPLNSETPVSYAIK